MAPKMVALKLTWAKVRHMRRLFAEGGVYKSELARRFGVSGTLVSYIVYGTSWPDSDYTPPAKSRYIPGTRVLDLRGMRFGRLITLAPDPTRSKRWLCSCSKCGRFGMSVLGSNLQKGVGCGCKRTLDRSSSSPPHVPGACWIPLGNGNFALVDEADYALASTRLWRMRHDTKSGHGLFYAETGKGFRLHNLLMNPSPGTEVDHINHNGLDNRRQNLRCGTHRQNMNNQRRRLSCPPSL